MQYDFYGWERADVPAIPAALETYPGIHTPRDLYRTLSRIWCEETCTPRLRFKWSPENKTLGQCSITAFLAQDIFGGRVFGIPLDEGGYHCYNVVDDRIFDLTSEQFAGRDLDYSHNPEQFREVHFAKEEKLQRYEYLKAELRRVSKPNALHAPNAPHVPAARNNLAWEEVKTEHIIQNEWIDFRRSTYRFPDGTVFEPFYTYSRRDYVVIVASDTEGNYICVRQFRQGIKEVTTEFPAGGLERSDEREYRTRNSIGASEDALDAAKRELMEETGYESDDWTHLLTIPSNATIADNYAFVYMARNCRKVAGQNLDKTEFLIVETHSADEIEKLIRTGNFQQSVHVMAWLLAKEKISSCPHIVGVLY